MPVPFFIRRTLTGTQPASQQYLFLVGEGLVLTSQEALIAPTLPGNDSSSTAGGPGSTNFDFSLGMHRFQIQSRGVFIDLQQSHFPPSLPANNYNPASPFTPFGGSPGSALYLPGGTTTPPNPADADLRNRPTAKGMRSMFINFFADQINYTDFCLGWPKWLDDGLLDPFPNSTTINGVGYRLWRGHIANINTPEISTDIKQYPWNLTFTVGNPI